MRALDSDARLLFQGVLVLWVLLPASPQVADLRLPELSAPPVDGRSWPRERCRIALSQMAGQEAVNLRLAVDSDDGDIRHSAFARPCKLQCLWRRLVVASFLRVRHLRQPFLCSAIGAAVPQTNGMAPARRAARHPNLPRTARNSSRTVFEQGVRTHVCPYPPSMSWISDRRRKYHVPCCLRGQPTSLPLAPTSGRSSGWPSFRGRTKSCASLHLARGKACRNRYTAILSSESALRRRAHSPFAHGIASELSIVFM